MRNAIYLSTIGLMGLAIGMGCQPSPPPPQVPVPVAPSSQAPMYPANYPKPLPDQTADQSIPAEPFNDQALVSQRMPEEGRFVSMYNQVGRPRLVVLVNRTPDRALIPPQKMPVTSVEHTQTSSGSVNVESSQASADADWYHATGQASSDKFSSSGPAQYNESTTVYLHPGEYDEALLKSLDYGEMEGILTDWLSCNGQVTLVSPMFAHQQLSDQQSKDLSSGKSQSLGEVGQQLGVDIIIQVQARPVRRADTGVKVLLVAEAINVKGGESIAHAVVEIPPPIDKVKLNDFTRFTARKLMDGMIGTWTGAPPQAPTGAATTPPPAPPTTRP